MRKLENINPVLDTKMLEKAGLKFDGYYYTNNNVPFQLRYTDKGYEVTMKDPGLPPLPIRLNKYSDLIAFMGSALQFAIQDAANKGTLVISSNNYKPLTKFVHDWWAFDSDLHYMVTCNEQGIMIVPNDEYTFSLTNGSIRTFTIWYKNTSGIMSDCSEVIECTPQCISWPFLVSYIHEICGVKEDDIVIEKVELTADGITTPYFGMGIPKINTSAIK